ncbi:MAG: phospholipase D-like domain-containing protein [Granulosicoccus sp.]
MSVFKTGHGIRKIGLFATSVLLFYVLGSMIIRALVPPPTAVSIDFPTRIASSVRFFNDESWVDEAGQRRLSQRLFSALFDGIKAAKSVIIVDMFLFNAWQGPVPETHRRLSSELTDVLIGQQQRFPEMDIVVISDPINTVYGGLPSIHFERLKSAGVHVVLTDLDKLQDSNPLWSGVWRWLIRPWGNDTGRLLPNPFGEGKVSVRSYLSLLNFKANHRKLMIADDGGEGYYGWISSANPHDGSSAHRNIAVQFDGLAVLDLLESERTLLAMSEAPHVLPIVDKAMANAKQVLSNADPESAPKNQQIQILSESKIHAALVEAIDSAGEGSDINMVMFYLSERSIIESLKNAVSRGARVRILLDVNNDAFGRKKNGVPNRPVAAELVQAGASVRWCATLGEQCHAKWLHVADADAHKFFMGSANFTRRNLKDLNLETDILLTAPSTEPVVKEMISFFERQWNNEDGKQFSVPYEQHANDSVWLKLQYRMMESTGLSTF